MTIEKVPADTNAAFTATIRYSETVTGFAASDLLLSNLAASDFSGSGKIYSVTLTPKKEGSYSVQVPADAALDVDGNGNTASDIEKGTYDKTAPSVTITEVPAVTNAAFEVSITFSEQVTEFAASDLSLVNLTASDFSGSGTAYKVTLTPSTEGTYSVQMPTDAALDAAGNGNTASVVHTGKYDATAPTVTIAKVVDSEGEVSSTGAFDVAITFSETVSGFAALDLALANLNASNFKGSGATYSATLTPLASGAYSAQVPASVGLDLAGNGNTASNVLTGDFNGTRPTVTISGVPDTTRAANFDATITFSESVTGFAASDLSLTNLNIVVSPESVGSGTTYQVTLAPIAEGEFSVQVPADVATNLAGNGNTASQTHTGKYDITAPTVTIAKVVGPEGEVSSNGAFDVAITFSETVTGFASSDLALTNLTASNFRGSGATYSATLTPVASGAYSAQVPASAASDAAGNKNTASNILTGDYDGTGPTVTITGVPADTNAAYTAKIRFSEAVTGFAVGDLSLSNLTASGFSGLSSTIYSVTLTPNLEGPYSVQVPAKVATDEDGNMNMASDVHTGKYDVTAPKVTIAKVVSPEGEVSSNGAFDVLITFSETVSGFAASDLALANLNASNFKGSGATYSATLTPLASGAYSAQVPASVGLDLAGNGNTASNVLTGDFNGTRPTVTISGVPDTTRAANFDATITFSESVTGFAASDLSLTNLNIVVSPESVGSGTTYQVTLAPIAEGEFSVQVPADVATNLAGNGNTASQTHTGKYDITAPTVTIAKVVGPEGEVSSNGAFDVAITFSETVTGFASSDLALTNLTASNFRGSGATYSATLTPVASGAYSAQVPASAASDAAGNKNTASNILTGDYDGTGPTVTITGVPADTNAAYTAKIRFSEAVTGFAVGDLSLSNLTASGFSGLSSTIYSVTLTPNLEGPYSVQVPAKVATDEDGNMNMASDVHTGKYDVTAPKVTIAKVVSPEGEVSSNGAFDVLITFSETVSGFAASDLALANLNASNFKGSGATYSATLTPLASGAYSAQVPASVGLDLAGNGNTASNVLTGDFNGTRPTVTISGVPDTTRAANFDATITFSESVTGFAASDLSLTNLNIVVSPESVGSGTTYQVTLAPIAEGEFSVQVPADVATNLAGNGNTASQTHTGKYDITAPTVTIAKVVGPEGEVSSNGAFDVAITFSETVTGFASSDLALTNLTASNFRGSGATYSATLTPVASGAYSAQVPASAASDAAGNKNTASNILTGDYDGTGPTVTITGVPADTNAAYTAKIRFSEAVTGFAVGDLSLSNLTASGFSGSGTAYSVTLTPVKEGAYSVQVPANVAANLAGNTNTASSVYTGFYDETRPTVTISNVPSFTNGAFTATISFSESVTGFSSIQLSLSNLTASGFSGSGSSYSVTLTPVAEGAYSIQVSAGAARDAAGNWNTASSVYTGIYDAVRPAVTIAGVPSSCANAAFTATISFSEAVTGFVASDLSLNNLTASGFSGSGSSYSVTLTPSAAGTYSIQVPANVATDAAGNKNKASSAYSGCYSITRPSVTIAGVPAYTNAAFSVTVTFSESVTGFAASDLSLSNLTASGFSGSGTAYSVTLTPVKEGAYSVQVPANVAANLAGNTNTASSTYTGVYDVTAPTVTISNVPSFTNGAFTAAISFSESVTGFSSIQLSLSNLTASGFSGSGSSYSVTLTPVAEGAYSIQVSAGAARDAAGNWNTASSVYTGIYDAVRPAVTIAGVPSSCANAAFTATISFSEAVTGFVASDLSLNNLTASGFSGSGSSYSVTLTPSAAGTYSIQVPANVATDAAGNKNKASSAYSGCYSITRPSVTIAGVSAYTNAAFSVTVTFSESVTGFAASDLSLSNLTASGFSGSGSNYSVTLTPVKEGAYSVQVPANVAANLAGNTNTASSTYTGVYDVTAPTVTISNVPSFTNGAFTAAISFSESVTGFSSIQLSLSNLTASGFSGSGSSYSVTLTPVAEGAYSIQVSAGAARDAAGNWNTASSVYTGIYDAVRPAVTIAGVPSSCANAAFTATISFSEAVTGFVASDLSLNNLTASGFSGSGSSYSVTLTPSAAGTYSIQVPANVATDAAGNKNKASSAYSGCYSITRPSVTIAGVSAYTNAAFSVTVTFSESVTGFAASDLSLSNLTASGFSGSGSNYSVTLTPNSEGAYSVKVPAGVATTLAGNTNTASSTYTGVYDVTAPTVTISRGVNSDRVTPPSNSAFSVTITFSEAVTGFTSSDLALSNLTASGFSGSGSSYSVTLTPVTSWVYSVQVPANAATDLAGNGNTASSTIIGPTQPAGQPFQLSSNYPNPFNPTTLLSFSLQESMPVKLVVYDMAGREVARLADGEFPAGSHEVRFDGSHLASGVYYFMLTAGSHRERGSMLLLK